MLLPNSTKLVKGYLGLAHYGDAQIKPRAETGAARRVQVVVTAIDETTGQLTLSADPEVIKRAKAQLARDRDGQVASHGIEVGDVEAN